MGRFDELGSGVINVNHYLPLYADGAMPKFIENDMFTTILPLESEEVTKQIRPESRPESRLADKVLNLLGIKEFGKSELASELGHKSISGELKKQVKILVDEDLIEMTIPEKPNSRMQKYRLTDKGKNFIKESNNE
jgi:ATP-dependent DNA helicase RecG